MNAGQKPDLNYYERQHFAAWVYLVLVGVVLSSFAPFLGMNLSEQRGALIAAGIFACSFFGLALALNVFRMNTEVRYDSLYIHFGIFFPMIWKTILLNTVVEINVVKYRPLRDAGGWGWRCGRFEKQRAWFYNAKGDKGVLITTTEGRRYIIGSQQPVMLAEALKRACGIA